MPDYLALPLGVLGTILLAAGLLVLVALVVATFEDWLRLACRLWQIPLDIAEILVKKLERRVARWKERP
jgi:hypothetical protein